MKKENNNKNFAAHEKWMETKRANRPKQMFARLHDVGMYAVGREISGTWIKVNV